MMSDTKKIIKTKILENWYVMDSILLNEHANKKIKSPKLFEQYVSLKTAFLHTLWEYYNHINYVPEYKKVPNGLKQLTECAQVSAKQAKKLAAHILHKEEVRQALKTRIINESKGKNIKDPNSFSDKIIQEKFIQLSLDNALIGIPVLEAKRKSSCNDFKGELLSDSYSMYRNAIIKLSRSCMNK